MQLLIFKSAFCSKCPTVVRFLEQHAVDFQLFDTEIRTDLVSQFHIQSVPTTILLDDRQVEIHRSIGVNPPELMKIIQTIQGVY
ncbi:thioredoxin family protein [Bacillus sp. FJAT-50079]|uniref:TlpA family protein disulfide reductase n=1 Tax=Bacillus sp. FJAT-50079 TaxID=2833577 RepID=UPI001BC9648E|nr:thioredoxin family protein [Bacillus sp. FJAT-50079]MBS4207010.1 hypothetical protein [Bacillus sp. FJAT-50079]